MHLAQSDDAVSNKPKRHHYIPQYLLRRFASRSVRDRYWVWQFRTGSRPAEVVTRDAAVSTQFHGSSENNIERRLSELEGRQANLLRQLDAGVEPARLASELRDLIWSLAFRTRSLREKFILAAGNFVDELRGLSGDSLRKLIEHELDSRLEEYLKPVLKQVSNEQRQMVYSMLRDPCNRMELISRCLPGDQVARNQLGELCKILSPTLRPAANNGHVQALDRLLSSEALAPPVFEVSQWEVRRYGSNAVVLGDQVVVGVSQEGVTGVLGQFTAELGCVVLPISHEAVVVGASRGFSTQFLDAEFVNRASSKHAFDTLFASDNRPSVLALHELVGTSRDILGSCGVHDIVQEMISDAASVKDIERERNR